MSLKLNDFLQYKDIIIQCHDNPDADALASGYAVWWYFRNNGIKAEFVYSGKSEIQKSNLVLMMEYLHIPVKFVTELRKPELLVTVDCQYGESNVTRFEAENIAVIDHHQISGLLPDMSEVRSNYGSCSTLLGELLSAEGIDYNDDECIATALYYGLMTDTNGFTEVSHPADKDLRDRADYRKSDITLFRNSNLSRQELEIAGNALKSAVYNDDEKYRYAIVGAQPCDPNILGVISDMLLEVDTVSTCLVYSVLPFGVKISVRSCTKDVKASELAAYIANGLGGGGGHLVKAGGFLKRDLIEKAGIAYTEEAVAAFLEGRIKSYYDNSTILYAGQHVEDLSKMRKYSKLDILIGYAPASKVAPIGSKVTVRTLEGDIDIEIAEDVYIIVGIQGEIYPIRRSKFEASYMLSDEEYKFPGEYPPTLINYETGDRISLLPFVHSCIAKGGSFIYARQLTNRVKVFTAWDPDKYYLGVEGDYLAARSDDPSDIYIIAKDIFAKSYKEV